MKQTLPLIFLCGVMALGACNRHNQEVASLSDLEGGKTFAVPTGTVADQFVLERFPDAQIEYYNSVFDCALAVKGGKADAAIYDKPILKNIAAKNEGLKVLDELLADDQYGFAVSMGDPDLKRAIDEVLADLRSSGTYDEMLERWLPEKGEPGPMPPFSFTGESGVLRFGTAAVTEPMSFVNQDRVAIGFDIELASHVAVRLGKKLEIIDMEFGAMLPALIAGKVDMIGAGLSITEERAKKVLFSQSYYPSGIAAVISSQGQKAGKGEADLMSSAEDIPGRRIGVVMGSIYDGYSSRTYPTSPILQYQTVPDMLMALNTDKIDVIFIDNESLPDVFEKNPALGLLEPNVFFVPIAAPFHKESTALREQFNTFLKEIRSNGTYEELKKRWMDRTNGEMPPIEGSSANGQLKIGIVSDIGLPSAIMKNGKPAGFDIELGTRFAAWMGREYVPVDLPFGAMIAALATKKVDMATCSMMITEERKKQIDFSDPYWDSGASVIAVKSKLAAYQQESRAEKVSFFKSLGQSFHNNIILENRYLLIVNGLKITIIISILAALIGTLIGGLICYMRMSRQKWLSVTARGFISLIRGTPVLVLLMIIFYVVFASVNINAVLVAVIAFGINFGAYVSEMFRTSIQGVDRGQWEAGIASGFTRVRTFIHIILPQALRQVLPVYKGEFISLVKMTSIVGYIAVQDLTKASDIIRSRTFDAFFPLLMAAFIYLILAWILTWGLGRIEVSVDPKRKRIRKIREEIA
ncbi:MAG: ABC transporter permease subunit [Bacteroidales bacterium]